MTSLLGVVGWALLALMVFVYTAGFRAISTRTWLCCWRRDDGADPAQVSENHGGDAAQAR